MPVHARVKALPCVRMRARQGIPCVRVCVRARLNVPDFACFEKNGQMIVLQSWGFQRVKMGELLRFG